MAERTTIIHISVVICFYAVLLAPIVDRPFQQDEIVNTFMYLNKTPFSNFFQRGAKPAIKEWNWATDWKRQIVIHPPLLYYFYYCWIRIFGDTEIILRIPAILFGLSGIILLYLVGLALFDRITAILATFATSFSIAYVTYSTEAVPAIFESFFLLASLLCFSTMVITRKKRLFPVLIALNILGACMFYQYFAYLFIQTVLLWFYRRKLNITKYYFISACFIIVLFFTMIVTRFIGEHPYTFAHWMQSNSTTLLKVIGSLPYRGIGVSTVPERYSGIFIFKYFSLLFILPLLMAFLAGCVFIMFAFKKSADNRGILKLVLIGLFGAQFLFYLAVGSLVSKFGEPRNFFYLLPIYFLIIFYGLRQFLRNKKIFYFVSISILVFFLMSSTFYDFYYFPLVYREREIIRQGAKLNASLMLIPSSLICPNPFRYYTKRYGFSGKIRRLKGAIGKMSKGDKYTIGSQTFTVVKIIRYDSYYGPFKFLQKLFLKPSPITIYLLH